MTTTGKRIVAGVPDLFFATKIGATARHLGIRVDFAETQDKLLAKISDPPAMIIVDLGAANWTPLSLIEKIKADPLLSETPVVGFANHERSDLMDGAKAAGCDQVLTRGAFSNGLPEILRRVSGQPA
jgi:CheY-like chemotaxis protein